MIRFLSTKYFPIQKNVGMKQQITLGWILTHIFLINFKRHFHFNIFENIYFSGSVGLLKDFSEFHFVKPKYFNKTWHSFNIIKLIASVYIFLPQTQFGSNIGNHWHFKNLHSLVLHGGEIYTSTSWIGRKRIQTRELRMLLLWPNDRAMLFMFVA